MLSEPVRRPGRRAGLVALGTCGEGDGSSDDEEEDEEQEVSPDSGLGRRTREKLTQIRKVVDAAKMSPSLNFAERGDEEDKQYTPAAQKRYSTYLDLTNGTRSSINASKG